MDNAAIIEATKCTTDTIKSGAVNIENPASDEIIFDSSRHFVSDRYAVLFANGTYKGLDLEVGYYTQLAGLGVRADDVKFVDCNYGPYCPALNKDRYVGDRPGLSLDTFWRMAENYCSSATKGQLWAVSQAAPIRRVHAMGKMLPFMMEVLRPVVATWPIVSWTVKSISEVSNSGVVEV